MSYNYPHSNTQQQHHPQGQHYVDEGAYAHADSSNYQGGYGQQQQPQYDYNPAGQYAAPGPAHGYAAYNEGYDLGNVYSGNTGGFQAPTPGPSEQPQPQPQPQYHQQQQQDYRYGGAADMSQDIAAANAAAPNVYEGDNGQPPHHNLHWVDQNHAVGGPRQRADSYGNGSDRNHADPNNGRLGVPLAGGGGLRPTYTNDTFVSNTNPFETPGLGSSVGPGQSQLNLSVGPGQSQLNLSVGPGGRLGNGRDASTEHIPLLDQGGGYHAPGGFVDPSKIGMDDDYHQVRYGRIPQRIPRRLKTIKQVALFRGNLCLDVPVPKKLLDVVKLKDDREFTRMRYTAATCDPDDFVSEKYALRQVLMNPPRQTELMIVMTMYNEGEDLFTRTMYGVQKNIQHLCTRNRSKMWGGDAWKKVVVVIVSDGRKKINSRTLSVLATQGIYQEGVAKNVVNGKPVTCHIYEYTTQIAVTPDLKYKGHQDDIVPVQVIFALKEQNQKKINSHRWFFNAFAKCLKPNVCVLLDVGTRPGPTSIYHLWKAFDTNSNVGGACGEIVTLKGQYGQQLLNPLVAAQNFEYKMSNILDKPLESVFGYITVLPGAFSAYRWHALQNDALGNGPLAEYFKGEKLESAVDADLLTKNMYLAEDRVLCWELVSKRASAWTLHYTKSAYAVTDTPDQVPELISQRRRWLNGSFFAAIHATVKFGYLYRSDHSFLRKGWLHIELIYQLFQQFFAWFSLGNYFIAFSILISSIQDPSFGLPWTKYVNTVFYYVYLGLLVMCFLLAMGNRPQGSKKMFTFAMLCFAIITAWMTFIAFFIAVKGIINEKNAIQQEGKKFNILTIFANQIFRSIVLSIVATYGLWLYSSLIFFEPWHMFTSIVQYLLLAPSYINVINVYAFCNVHDVSWGTKGSTTVHTDLGVVKASGDGKDKVDVDVPKDSNDLNAAYEDAKHVLAQKPPKEVKSVDLTQKMEDSYKNIRTNVVLIWALTNGALVAGIIGSGASGSFSADGSNNKVNIYMTILLYAVAGLAFIKSVGATIYMIFWLFQG